MIHRLDEARAVIQAINDPDEKAFIEVAFKTAFVDIRAGVGSEEFDYPTFLDVMRALYRKKVLVVDVLQGKSAKYRWWDDDP